jgi:uncharacterized protein (TIGR02271 family)
MAQTVIGIFDSFEEANRAAERLVSEGIARTDIQVQARDAGGPLSDETTAAASLTGAPGSAVSTDRDNGHAPEGTLARIERFFSNLFGSNDRPEEVGHYHEAVRRGGALLSVDLRDEVQAANARALLNDAGAIDLDERVAQWRSTGYKGYDPSAREYTADEVAAERKAFPIVREDLKVAKREVQTGGVRVYSRATETPVSASVSLRDEHASIERRPVERPATAEDLREAWVEVRETAEQPVVTKTAHVIEEVVVGKQATERTETIKDTVRGTEVKVERVEGQSNTSQERTKPTKPV